MKNQMIVIDTGRATVVRSRMSIVRIHSHWTSKYNLPLVSSVIARKGQRQGFEIKIIHPRTFQRCLDSRSCRTYCFEGQLPACIFHPRHLKREQSIELRENDCN
jgi:hypothetical protein